MSSVQRFAFAGNDANITGAIGDVFPDRAGQADSLALFDRAVGPMGGRRCSIRYGGGFSIGIMARRSSPARRDRPHERIPQHSQ